MEYFGNAFNAKQTFFIEKKIDKRKVLLTSYAKEFLRRVNLDRDKILYEENRYDYAYIPLADDLKLQYEFWFCKNGIKTCLHLEGGWVKYRNLFEEIEQKDVTEAIFYKGLFEYGYEISYFSTSVDDIEFIVRLMESIYNITSPILANNRLLPDKN